MAIRISLPSSFTLWSLLKRSFAESCPSRTFSIVSIALYVSSSVTETDNARFLDIRPPVLLEIYGGPARIRTGDRQVSRTRGYEPAALSVLQPEENLAELRALQETRSHNPNS